MTPLTPAPLSVTEWVERLHLQPHPEGGYYRETYRSEETLSEDGLPLRYKGARTFGTCIYFLLTGDSFSAFHKLESDEMWHWYAGNPLKVHVLHPNGQYELLNLGPDARNGQQFQGLVHHGCWFAAEVEGSNGNPAAYSLCGNTVNPGFEFEDFLMADPQMLVASYPQHEALIRRLTR